MKNEIKFTEEEQETSAKNIDKLKKGGIIVTQAEFNAAVNGGDNTPEYGFNVGSDKYTRRAKMWLLPGGSLLCEQEDIDGKMKTFFIPPTFKYAHLK